MSFKAFLYLMISSLFQICSTETLLSLLCLFDKLPSFNPEEATGSKFTQACMSPQTYTPGSLRLLLSYNSCTRAFYLR